MTTGLKIMFKILWIAAGFLSFSLSVMAAENDDVLAEINSVQDDAPDTAQSTMDGDTGNNTASKPLKILSAKDYKKIINLQRCRVNNDKQVQQNNHFSLCDNGATVKDNETGLVWSRCAVGKTWNSQKHQCEGEAEIYNWREALNAVKKLNAQSYLSFNDWRLPNVKELATLVNLDCALPAIDKKVFPGTDNAGFWTSTVFEQYPARAWYIDFKFGEDYPADKRYFHQIRLVRLGYGLASYNQQTGKTAASSEACASLLELSFSPISNVPVSSLIESEAVSVNFTGNSPDRPVSIKNGEYQINSGAWTNTPGSIQSGAILRVRHTSAASYLTDTTTTVHIGATTAVFTSTTMAEPQKEEVVAPYEDVMIGAEVLFDYDSYQLSDEAKASIKEYVEQYRSRFDEVDQIQVIGHTDNIASQKYNLKLSEKRAQAVAQYIETISGIPDTHIEAIGKGKLEPVASNDTEEGRAKNRRVVIRFEFK